VTVDRLSDAELSPDSNNANRLLSKEKQNSLKRLYGQARCPPPPAPPPRLEADGYGKPQGPPGHGLTRPTNALVQVENLGLGGVDASGVRILIEMMLGPDLDHDGFACTRRTNALATPIPLAPCCPPHPAANPARGLGGWPGDGALFERHVGVAHAQKVLERLDIE
jgi:hypothetical protein